jgi:hypothetical protein
MAEHCSLAPRLSVEYPESRDNTRRGSKVDQQVSLTLLGKELPDGEELTIEAEKILDWLAANYPTPTWEYFVQRKVALIDPETGEELTGGTPDLVCYCRATGQLVIIDWKSKGQMWAGHLPAPRSNPQLLSYLTATWLDLTANGSQITGGRVVLACWDASGVSPQAEDFGEDILSETIRRVRAVPKIDLDSARPEAVIGEHCEDCYQRMHCSAHLLPATLVPIHGLPAPGFFEGVTVSITADNIAAALAWVDGAVKLVSRAKKLVELVEENANAYVKQNGPVTVGELEYGPVPTKGKRMGATVGTLEKEGLQRLIRPGNPGVKYDWYPALKSG